MRLKSSEIHYFGGRIFLNTVAMQRSAAFEFHCLYMATKNCGNEIIIRFIPVVIVAKVFFVICILFYFILFYLPSTHEAA